MKNALALHPKVSATLLTSWISTIIIFSLQQWADVSLPSVVTAALIGLIGFLAGYITPSP